MKSPRISLLLIVLLLLTNMFIILNINSVERTKNILPDQMIQDAVKLLEQAGVSVRADAIPQRRPDSPIFEGGVSDGELSAFVEGFSAQQPDALYPLPEGRMSLSAGGYIFEFYHKLSFSLYRQDAALPQKVQDALEQENPPGDSLTADKRIIRRVKKDIKPLFVRDEGAINQILVEGCIFLGEDSYVAYISRLTQGLEVEGQAMRILVEKGKISAARGIWNFEGYLGKYSMPLMDSVNILFKAKDSSEDFSGIIIQMKLHYNTIWHSGDRYYLIPSWKISFEDGRELVLNALTGDLIS